MKGPKQIDGLLVVGGALAAVPLIMTVLRRRVHHLYVSAWYLIGALVWFPMLYITGNLHDLFTGTEQGILNWWYAHNVLGLWMTPLGLAAAYYFIPKMTGTPIYSYTLSLVGFWALALFYSQVGVHHLIGGPVPTWLATLSIVTSVMMVIPVVAVAVNHHMTVLPKWRMVLSSPTLRFVVLGAMMYTFASVQGSIEALRTVNTITHFTHYTVAHAHMGVYGFFSFVLFGSIYFIMPRLLNWEWPHTWAISAHCWLVFLGFGVYFWPLSVGGWLQGLAMLDATRPFMESVTLTMPYLQARSVGGIMMTIGHMARGLGRPSVPSDYSYDTTHLLGTMRTGPDLFNIGARQPSVDWHLTHLYQPRAVSPGSNMPAYPFLFLETDYLGDRIEVKVPREYLPPLVKYIVPTQQAMELVDYLLSMDHTYPAEELPQAAPETEDGAVDEPVSRLSDDTTATAGNNIVAGR